MRRAAAQYGVIVLADALALGVSPSMITRRVSSGLWERLYPGVYRVGGASHSWRQSLLAACFAWGQGALISHRAAAALWEFPGFEPGPIELIVPRKRERAHPHVVRRPRALTRAEVTTIGPIPVTTPARTLLDIAGVCSREVVEEALDDVLRRRPVSRARLRS